jgi:hypothetical protein
MLKINPIGNGDLITTHSQGLLTSTRIEDSLNKMKINDDNAKGLNKTIPKISGQNMPRRST